MSGTTLALPFRPETSTPTARVTTHIVILAAFCMPLTLHVYQRIVFSPAPICEPMHAFLMNTILHLLRIFSSATSLLCAESTHPLAWHRFADQSREKIPSTSGRRDFVYIRCTNNNLWNNRRHTRCRNSRTISNYMSF